MVLPAIVIRSLHTRQYFMYYICCYIYAVIQNMPSYSCQGKHNFSFPTFLHSNSSAQLALVFLCFSLIFFLKEKNEMTMYPPALTVHWPLGLIRYLWVMLQGTSKMSSGRRAFCGLQKPSQNPAILYGRGRLELGGVLQGSDAPSCTVALCTYVFDAYFSRYR